MRISKMVLSFALVTAVSAISVTSSASSSCNMRDGKGRFSTSNPPEKRAGKAGSTANKSTHDVRVKSRHGKK